MAELPTERGRILIADDEPGMAHLLSVKLQSDGHIVTTVSSGQEALRSIQAGKPDLLILDVMMPGMTGLEVCAALRARPETAGLPIIILSALAQVPDRVRGLQIGADEYIPKPVELSELSARVAALLRRSRLSAQDKPSEQHTAFAFIGAKGGVGTTTVALNLAGSLTRGGNSVIALEMHPAFGGFALQLKSTPQPNLGSLLQKAPAHIDARLLQTHLQNPLPGLRALFGPQTVEEFGEIEPARAEEILERALVLANFVIVDLPQVPSPASIAMLNRCDRAVVVLEPEAGSVAAARLALEFIRKQGTDSGQMAAVAVNRGIWSATMTLNEVKIQLGCEVLGLVTSAGDTMAAACRQGTPLTVYRPETTAATALAQIAERLAAPTLVGTRG